MHAPPEELAREILAACRAGLPYSEEAAAIVAASPALFPALIEPLSDLFEPRLTAAYARIFARVIARLTEAESAEAILERYERIRAPRPFAGPDPARVFVLSRVTLGADIAVTSVFLDAAKKRWPRARLIFAGSRKAWELFEADPRLEFHELAYPRAGSLADRLRVRFQLDGLVIDPDSRLTQLGLLPVCDDASYLFWESRSYKPESGETLSALAVQWCAEILGVHDAKPFLAPKPSDLAAPTCVSLGVGENQAKRIADPFELDLIRALPGPILLDRGAGGEESARVDAIAAAIGPRVATWTGAFAPFADAIRRASYYVGYDSAGQHAAAVSGVPLTTVFAGAISDRFFERWRPSSGRVIRADGTPASEILAAATGGLVG